jgi:ribosomal protein S27E
MMAVTYNLDKPAHRRRLRERLLFDMVRCPSCRGKTWQVSRRSVQCGYCGRLLESERYPGTSVPTCPVCGAFPAGCVQGCTARPPFGMSV